MDHNMNNLPSAVIAQICNYLSLYVVCKIRNVNTRCKIGASLPQAIQTGTTATITWKNKEATLIDSSLLKSGIKNLDLTVNASVEGLQMMTTLERLECRTTMYAMDWTPLSHLLKLHTLHINLHGTFDTTPPPSLTELALTAYGALLIPIPSLVKLSCGRLNPIIIRQMPKLQCIIWEDHSFGEEALIASDIPNVTEIDVCCPTEEGLAYYLTRFPHVTKMHITCADMMGLSYLPAGQSSQVVDLTITNGVESYYDNDDNITTIVQSIAMPEVIRLELEFIKKIPSSLPLCPKLRMIES